MTPINTGLNDEARASVAEALNNVLADTYTLYLKTHSYHWNVTGPHFPALHAMFEEQYLEMWNAMDEIAERVRALGEFAPASGKVFGERTVLTSAEDAPPPADTMIANLLNDHGELIARTRTALDIAGEANDAASEDLLTVRIQTHEKTTWMLRAMSE